MTFSASEHLAQGMFNAEYGYSGFSWSNVSSDFQDEWRRKASHVLEGLYSPETPIVVIDLREDTIELREA